MNKHIKNLLIKTRKSVFSQHIGNNTSNLKGEGYDFVELREYVDGEDIRKIDWVITAKMQKPYVKVFRAQRELEVNIVPILSGSTHFGTQRLKKDVITEICSILGYISSAQGDSFSSYIANESAFLSTKKTKKLFGVDKMIEYIYQYNPIGKNIDYRRITNDLFTKIQKKSLIFLIGDFFNCKDLHLNLLSKKHEVIVIIVRDEFEESPTSLGNVNLTDPGNNSIFEGDLNSSLINKYIKEVRENDRLMYVNLQKAGIEFTKIYTHDNITKELTKLFKR